MIVSLKIANDTERGTTSVLAVTDAGDSLVRTWKTGDEGAEKAVRLARKVAFEPSLESELVALLGESVLDRIEEKLSKVSDKMIRKGNRILFDGEPIDKTLESRLVDMDDKGAKGADWNALLKFTDRVMYNVDERVRTQLFSWMDACDGFSLTPEGMIVGYKGCTRDYDGNVVSIHSGHAYVEHDGDATEYKSARIPNRVGDTVWMPRGEVENNPNSACSYGLHVGTWNYASGFAEGIILTVEIDPSDVISVPYDSNAQKLRCCRYRIVGVAEHKHEVFTYGDTGCPECGSDLWDEDLGYCDDCGYDVADEYDEYDGDDDDSWGDGEDYNDDPPMSATQGFLEAVEADGGLVTADGIGRFGWGALKLTPDAYGYGFSVGLVDGSQGGHYDASSDSEAYKLVLDAVAILVNENS